MSVHQMIIGSIASMGNNPGGGGGGGGGIDYSFPTAGSGLWLTDSSTLGYTLVASQGTAYDPGGAVDSVDNPATGSVRRRIQTNNLGGLYPAPGPSPFLTSPVNVLAADTHLGFGFINDGTQENYALEWVGYLQAPATGNFNFVIQSDDRAWLWIGTNAQNNNNFWGNYHVASDNGSSLNPNSVSLVALKYYPIRIWFQEFSGAEYCQLYLAQAGSTPTAMTTHNVVYNANTTGL